MQRLQGWHPADARTARRGKDDSAARHEWHGAQRQQDGMHEVMVSLLVACASVLPPSFLLPPPSFPPSTFAFPTTRTLLFAPPPLHCFPFNYFARWDTQSSLFHRAAASTARRNSKDIMSRQQARHSMRGTAQQQGPLVAAASTARQQDGTRG